MIETTIVIITIHQVALYMRQRAAQPVDAELLLFGALAAVDALSGALVAVLAVVSLYWLALAKLQARARASCIEVPP